MVTEPVIRPVETLSAADRVAVDLRRSIVSGALAPGQTFSLRKVAAQLGVSFIPVREALRNLESEGLVVSHPGRSTRVAPLDLDELRAVYRLRRTLEPDIAERACLLLAEAELDRLTRLAVDFGDEERGMDAIYVDHHAFHMALLAPAASAWDLRILTTLWQASERYVRIAFGTLDPDPDEHHRRGQAHSTLVAAFRTRDKQQVAEAVRRHLSRNEQMALHALDPDRPPVASSA
ncbi:MAG TPA: GntR family transcriptional regulator [Pseudonocardia sp.]